MVEGHGTRWYQAWKLGFPACKKAYDTIFRVISLAPYQIPMIPPILLKLEEIKKMKEQNWNCKRCFRRKKPKHDISDNHYFFSLKNSILCQACGSVVERMPYTCGVLHLIPVISPFKKKKSTLTSSYCWISNFNGGGLFSISRAEQSSKKYFVIATVAVQVGAIFNNSVPNGTGFIIN